LHYNENTNHPISLGPLKVQLKITITKNMLIVAKICDYKVNEQRRKIYNKEIVKHYLPLVINV